MNQKELNFTKITEEDVVLGVLEKHKGKANAITFSKISEDTGIHERRVRIIKRDLILNRGIPVCSCNRGYYIPSTYEEREEAAAYIKKQMVSGLVVVSRLLNIKKEDVFGQLELELN